MKVMSHYKFWDSDVVGVRQDGPAHVREIVLKEENESSVLISKSDVIALAKEFDLVVFDKAAQL